MSRDTRVVPREQHSGDRQPGRVDLVASGHLATDLETVAFTEAKQRRLGLPAVLVKEVPGHGVESVRSFDVADVTGVRHDDEP